MLAIFSYTHAKDVELPKEVKSESEKEKKVDKRSTCSTCSYSRRTYYPYGCGTIVQRFLYLNCFKLRGIQKSIKI